MAFPSGRTGFGIHAGCTSPSHGSRLFCGLFAGLVLSHCEEDVMRLIYEMEYLAMVRLPGTAQKSRVERLVLAPLNTARCERGSADGKWWRHAHVIKVAAKALKSENFCVLDGFLPVEHCETLARAATQARPSMVRGATGAAGKVLKSEGYTANLERALHDPSRGDVVKFSDDGGMPGCLELYSALDTLVEGLQSCDEVAERLQFVDWANGAMFAIYPGNASRYIKHVDNTLGMDGRRLTAILYLNKHWEPCDGGCLRLFEPTMQNFQVKCDLEPIWNRLVVFWSTQEVPHEVLSAYKDRAAVSVWFICGRESLRHPEAFQRLFLPAKLRCIAGRSREQCLERAAQTQQERDIVRELEPGREFSDAQRAWLANIFRWRADDEVEAEHESEQDRAIKIAVTQALGGGTQPRDAFLGTDVPKMHSQPRSKQPRVSTPPLASTRSVDCSGCNSTNSNRYTLTAVTHEVPSFFEVVD